MTLFNCDTQLVCLADCFPHAETLPVASIWIWEIAIPSHDGIVARLASTLSDAERARANRFLVEPPRRAFITARAALRALLGHALGIAAAQIEIAIDPSGKPQLSGTLGDTLSFNLSHSGAAALVALGDGRPIGVDIECVRNDLDYLALARRHYPEAEHHALVAAGAGGRRAFFDSWARREAFLKAMGLGLGAPLEAVSLAGDRWGLFVPTLDLPAAPSGLWRGLDLPIAGVDAAAALCWRGSVGELVLRRFFFS